MFEQGSEIVYMAFKYWSERSTTPNSRLADFNFDIEKLDEHFICIVHIAGKWKLVIPWSHEILLENFYVWQYYQYFKPKGLRYISEPNNFPEKVRNSSMELALRLIREKWRPNVTKRR